MQDRPRQAQKPGSEHMRAPTREGRGRPGEVERVKGAGPRWPLVAAALVWVAGVAGAAAAESERIPTAGALAVRMSESLALPGGFSAVVRLEPYAVPGGGGAGGQGPQGGARGTTSLRLVGFPPDTFHWEPLSDSIVPGIAWRGHVRLDTGEPGPKFAYSYDGFPFLKVLDVYFSLFRPLPEGSRLVLSRSVRALGRAAVEATLLDARPWQQVRLVLDAETGLILEAWLPPEGSGAEQRLLVRASRYDAGAALTAVEYEAPVLGTAGRLVVGRRPPGGWFVVEAVVGGDGQAQRLRFEEVRRGPEAGTLRPPDVREIQRLVQLDQEARDLYRQRRYADAAERLRALLRIDPYNLFAHNLLGSAAMEQGDWVTASSEFDQVIHLAPDSPLGYNNLAYLYTELGLSLSAALELAEKAMELSGEEPQGYVLDTYGWALFHNGRAQEAVPVLERAVARSGDDPQAQAEVLYHLGVVQMALDRVEEARRLLTQALQLDPELEEARRALGRLEQEQAEQEGATEAAAP